MKNLALRAGSKQMVSTLVVWLLMLPLFFLIIITSFSSLLISSPLPSSNYRGSSFWSSKIQKVTIKWSPVALITSKSLSLTTLRPCIIKELHQNASDAFSSREVLRCQWKDSVLHREGPVITW